MTERLAESEPELEPEPVQGPVGARFPSAKATKRRAKSNLRKAVPPTSGSADSAPADSSSAKSGSADSGSTDSAPAQSEAGGPLHGPTGARFPAPQLAARLSDEPEPVTRVRAKFASAELAERMAEVPEPDHSTVGRAGARFPSPKVANRLTGEPESHPTPAGSPSDRPTRTNQPDHPDETAQPNPTNHPDWADHPDWTDQPDWADWTDRTDWTDQPDWADWTDRTDWTGQPGPTDHPDLTTSTAQPNRSGRADHLGRTNALHHDQAGQPVRAGQADSTDQSRPATWTAEADHPNHPRHPDHPYRTDRTHHSDRADAAYSATLGEDTVRPRAHSNPTQPPDEPAPVPDFAHRQWDDWAEEPPSQAGQRTLVRPYVLTRGRTQSRRHLAIEALVSTCAGEAQWDAPQVSGEFRSVRMMCHSPRSVAEVAATLSVPLGVARILLDDMAELGLVRIHENEGAGNGRPALELMERVLAGLQRL